MNLLSYLTRKQACGEAKDWADSKKADELWSTLTDPRWALWLLARMEKAVSIWLFTRVVCAVARVRVRHDLRATQAEKDEWMAKISMLERWARNRKRTDLPTRLQGDFDGIISASHYLTGDVKILLDLGLSKSMLTWSGKENWIGLEGSEQDLENYDSTKMDREACMTIKELISRRRFKALLRKEGVEV